MEYLKCETKQLESRGGFYTAKEISRQPDLWMETYHKLLNEKEKIRNFINKVLGKDCLYVILTGAGTSAFIGEALVGPFQKKWGVCTRAIATTDLITHPENYFMRSRPTLLISFARSGDSPESLATVELANKYGDELYYLNITCNKDGELARRAGTENSLVFLLPEETNDRSLAMTSSFTSMLLTGLLILDINQIDNRLPIVNKLKDYGNFILENSTDSLRRLAETDFQRMVFLGSGPLIGAAHESHLKVQELSDGNVICAYDSFLGFRHGPKAIVNKATVIAYLLSNNVHAKKYELDLIRSVNETSKGHKSIAIGNGFDPVELNIDLPIMLSNGISDIPEEFLPVIYLLPAQIIGFFKSFSLGLSPDSPSNSGSITRVVQGVTIYEDYLHGNYSAEA
ncbi:MAG TPA: sugar isomerase [Bacteroidales bacterium]|nr:sugar isomerase [Bacteroidales bacterium]HCU18800.1 sugar isomerase [Bacteroidales bacterium]